MKALELADELTSDNPYLTVSYSEIAAELRRLAAVEADCAPYLKEGETPAARIKRELGDSDSLMSLYRDVVAERDALKAELEAEREESKRWLVKAQNERDARKELEAELDALKAENALLEEVNAQLREQNDAVGKACAKYEAELERIKQSWDEWIKKTEWVQETYQPKELGRHRADVLRMRIEALQAELERIKAMPPVAWRSSMGHGVTLKESITDDQKALTWDGKPMWQPLIALGSKT